MNKRLIPLITLITIITSCRFDNQEQSGVDAGLKTVLNLKYAKGFTAYSNPQGIVLVTVENPWPESSRSLRYALVPKGHKNKFDLGRARFDAVIEIPANRIVLTSSTHIPALEALGAADKLIGFPGLNYVSSPLTRKRIDNGEIMELGANETLNTEKTIALQPDLLVGFGVSGEPRSYKTLKAAQIPVIYNGDWMEQDPLGKAEWIKFFGLLTGQNKRADSIFKIIESEYENARKLAAEAKDYPTVLSGALYRDIWYMPGGKSWGSQFLKDAHVNYLWADTPEAGSLSLSLEAVLDKAREAAYWISPSQFGSYVEMEQANPHYKELKAFKEKQVFTYALSKGPTGGLLYFELGPARPDWVLKDLIYFMHPGLLPEYEPVFFKPLQ